MMSPPLPPWPPQPALFLDLDGTLLEIADEPLAVAPSARLLALLPGLEPATGGAVALVSGRPLAEIDALFAPHRFAAAGMHGLERRDAAGRVHAIGIDPGVLAPLRARLAAYVAAHAGLVLEDKERALALHYRKRRELQEPVENFIAALEPDLPAGFTVLRGRCVFEIKLAAVDKGQAIERFLNEPPFAGRTPVFVGDDVTDEAGFALVNQRGGVSVKVNHGPTEARWHLARVDDVLGWLESVVGKQGVG